MSDRDDKLEIAHLHEMNEQLSASLDRCRSLLSACRTKLAANSNEVEDDFSSGALDGDEGEERTG